MLLVLLAFGAWSRDVEAQPHALTRPERAAAAAQDRRELVFVVDTVRGWPALVDDLPGGPEVVVIDGRRDGLAQIAAALRHRRGLAAIHVLSHGDVGRVHLGSTSLDADAVARRRTDLASIGHALRPGGDLLLYGCAVAGDGSGRPFIDAMADATGADVAASVDSTGTAAKGGNWTLEVTRGVVEATAFAPHGFEGLLVAFTDTFTTTFGSPASSFTSTLGGTSFTYTFTGAGDGGDLAWEGANGSGGSSSINALSSGASPSVERITITRTDLGDFTFNGIFINNTSGDTVTVAGYRDGVLVGSSQLMSGGNEGTLSFASLHVDEVRLTSADFFGTNFDDFSGDTNPPSTAPSLTATGTNPAFVEGGSAVDLYSSVSANTNDAGQTFTGLSMTVTNVGNGASERLSVDGTSIGLSNGNSGSLAGGGSYAVSVAAGTATVTLSGLTRSKRADGHARGRRDLHQHQ